MQVPFTKMQGLGNDFVIFDARTASLPALNWEHIAHRREGIGCDQVIVLENSHQANVKMRIINADGSEVEACGNATRCVAALVGTAIVDIETLAGILHCQVEDTQVSVEMGIPQFAERRLPFDGQPVEVSMGNPHLVFFRPDIHEVDLTAFGKPLETHPLFTHGTNVEIAEISSPHDIDMRVWERGSGITQACGTGACATLAAAIHRGLVKDSATIHMPGGALECEWPSPTASLIMRGEVSFVFQGNWPHQP